MATSLQQHSPVPDSDVSAEPVADLAPLGNLVLAESIPSGDVPARARPAPAAFAALRQQVVEATEVARTRLGRSRNAATVELCAALRALGGADDAAAAAAFLTEQLAEQVWEGLEERPKGWTARATAVEVLIGLGFPHALCVTPEDLTHLREQQQRPRGGWLAELGPYSRVALGVLGVATALELGLKALVQGYGADVWTLVIVLGFSWSGALLQLLTDRTGRWIGGWLMFATFLATLYLAVALGSPTLVFIGAATLLSGALIGWEQRDA